MQYTTIFDISQKGYDWIPAIIGFVFALAGVVGLNNRRASKAVRLYFTMPLIVGLALGLFSMRFQYNNRQYYQQLLDQERAQVVEGFIKDFHPMPKVGHSEEIFTINDTLFAYSDFLVTPAFNNTSPYGGPLKDGLYVRIYFTDSIEFDGHKAILRIELRQ